MNKSEKVPPMTLTDTETGTVYTLEFSRESVKFAESRKFVVSEVGDYPQTMVPELFFYAFRKNHQNVSRAVTDKIFDEVLGGLTGEQIERLLKLYRAPLSAVLRTGDEETVENPKMTVEL